MSNLGSASGAIRLDISSISRAATSVSKSVAKITDAFGQLAGRLAASSGQVEQSLASIANASAGLKATEANLRQLQAAVRQAGSAGAASGAGLAQVGTAAQRVGQQAGSAEAGVRRMGGSAQQAGQAVQRLGQAAGGADAGVGRLSAAVGRLGGEAARVTPQLNGMRSSLEQFSGRMAGVGATLTTAITAPLSIIGGGAIKLAADFQQSMNVLQAASGASGTQMEQLRAKAVELGADVALPGTSANDAAQAMLELAKAGVSVNDTLSASKGVLQLAAAAQTDNATAAQITAAALNVFGLAGDKAGLVADLLAGAANNSAASITDLGQALAQGGQAFASMISPAYNAEAALQDFNTSMTVLSNAGLSGSDGATALKNAIAKLQVPTEAGRATMEALGISVFNAQGQMLPFPAILDQVRQATAGMTQEARLNALSTIFQGDGLKAMLPILALSGQQYDALRDKVTASGQAQALSAAQTAGLKGAIGGLQSTLETVGLTIAGPFLGPLESIVRAVTTVVGSITTLPGPVLNAAVAFGAVAAAAGPIAFALSGIAAVVASLSFPFVALVGVIGAVGAAFASGAVSISVFGPILEQLSRIGDAVGAALGNLVGPASDWGSGVVAAFAEGIAAGVGYVADALSVIADTVSYWLTPGSPPPLLPELDKWGTGAAEAYLAGWSQADLGALTDLSDQIGQVIRSAGAAAGASDSSILEQVVGSRSAIQGAIDELRTTGSVSEAAFAAIRDASGPAGETTERLARAYVGVAKASQDAARAQRDMQQASGAVASAAVGLADALGSGNPALVAERRATLAAARSRQQDARARLDAAKTAGDAAQQQLDAITALIAAQKQQNDLIKEQLGLQKSAGGGGGGGGGPKLKGLTEEERAAQRAAAAQRQYELSIASTDEKLARLQSELSGLTEGSAEYYDKLGEIRQVEAAQAREREQAAKAVEQVADAQFQYQLATADTAGKLDLLRQKQQGLSQDSAEYYQVAQQIAQLEEQSRREAEKAAKTPAAGGGGGKGGGIKAPSLGGGGGPLAPLADGADAITAKFDEVKARVEGVANGMRAAFNGVRRPILDTAAAMDAAMGTGARAGKQVQDAVREVGRSFTDLPTALSTAIPAMTARLLAFIPIFVSTAGRWVVAIASGLAAGASALATAIAPVVGGLIDGIAAAAPLIAEAAAGWLDALTSWAVEALPRLVAGADQLGGGIGGRLAAAAPAILGAMTTWREAMLRGILRILPVLLLTAGQLLSQFILFLGQAAPRIAQTASAWFLGMAQPIAAALPGILATLGTVIASLISAIGAAAPGLIAAFGTWAMTVLGWAQQAAPGLFAAVLGLGQQVIGAIGGALPGIITSLGQWITIFAQWAVDALPGLLAGLGGLIGGLLDSVGAALPGIVAALATWAASFIEWVIQALPGLNANLLTLVSGLLAWIGERVPGIAAQLGQWILAFIGWVAETTPDLIIALGTMYGQFLTWIVDQAPGIISTLLQWAAAFTGWVLTTALPALLEALGTFFGELLGFIGGQIDGITTNAGKIGSAIIAGIRKGITDGWDALKNYVGNLAQSLLDAAKNAIDIGSPSRKFAKEFGEPIPQGAAVGIAAAIPTAVEATRRMAAAVAAVPVQAPAVLAGQATALAGATAAGRSGSGGDTSFGNVSVTVQGAPINSGLDARRTGREIYKGIAEEARYQRKRGT